jgi:hypothetical protein
MSRRNKYRLSTSTLGDMPIEGRETAVTIPEGIVITVEDDLSQAPGNSEVIVAIGPDKAVMFTIDVRQRGEEVQE